MSPPPPEVVAFQAVALRYCALVESDPLPDRDVLVDDLVAHLAELLAAGVRLRQYGIVSDAPRPPTPGPPDERPWRELTGRLAEALPDRYYPALAVDGFPDAGVDSEVVMADLVDDLADIWRGLREGLAELERGGAWEDAAWEWEFGFRHHWGRWHAPNALRYLVELR